MSGWQLDPERVRGVLRSAEEKRNNLEETLRKHRTSALVLDVSGGGWPVAAVPAALEGLLADQIDRLARMREHIDAGVVGTSLAVAAYEGGQEDMATAFERDTLAAAENGDLTPFLPYLEP